MRRRPAQPQCERQHRHDAERPDAEKRLAPARALDVVLDDRRPDGAGKVVAAREDPDRDAAPPPEPQRHVREQRREGRRAAETDEEPVRERVLPQALRRGGRGVAGAERDRADDDRHHDAEAVGEPPHRDAADAEADHRQRVGQRRVPARDAEGRLHRRQRDDDRPHADTADRRQQQRDGEPEPRVAGVDDAVRGTALLRRPAAVGGLGHAHWQSRVQRNVETVE